MTCKDITLDFHSLASKQCAIKGKNIKPPKPKQKAQFATNAEMMGRGLLDTEQKLFKLHKLVKQGGSLFRDDLNEQIEELISNIKQSLHQHDIQITALKELTKVSSFSFSQEHSTKSNATIIIYLYSKYIMARQQFDSVIQLWTKNLDARKTKMNMFVGQKRSVFDLPTSSLGSGNEHVSISMSAVVAKDEYTAARAREVEQLEEPLNELSQMFAELLKLISVQENSIQRIEYNIETALINTEKGERALITYWRNMQSNRGLIVKLFSVLICFVVLFCLLL